MSPFLGIVMFGMALMLGVMGARQFRMGYRVAGVVSIVIAAALFALVVWVLGGDVTAG